MTTKTTIAVRILDREYPVRCEDSEVSDLIASARELDAQMREAYGAGNSLGLDRIAVIAALNIAHENLRLRNRLAALDGDVAQLAERVEGALTGMRGPGEEPAAT